MGQLVFSVVLGNLIKGFTALSQQQSDQEAKNYKQKKTHRDGVDISTWK